MLKNKSSSFDYLFLFPLITIINFTILIILHLYTNKPMFEMKDLDLLNWGKVFSYVLVVPIIEEFCFRGIFILTQSKFLIIPVSLAIITLLSLYVKNTNLKYIFILLIILISLTFLSSQKFRDLLIIFISNNNNILIVLTALIFASIHLFNYDTLNLVTFIRVIPRFLGGLYLGYIATKYGILHSTFMHGINNILPFLIIIYYKYYLHL